MSWRGRGNFGCCGPPRELQIAYQYWKQPDYYDGPNIAEWSEFISWAHNQMLYYSQSIQSLRSALDDLQAAQTDAVPQSKERLGYMINRTYAYILHQLLSGSRLPATGRLR